ADLLHELQIFLRRLLRALVHVVSDLEDARDAREERAPHLDALHLRGVRGRDHLPERAPLVLDPEPVRHDDTVDTRWSRTTETASAMRRMWRSSGLAWTEILPM